MQTNYQISIYSCIILKGNKASIKCICWQEFVLSHRNKILPGEFPFQGCEEFLRNELRLSLKDSIHLLSWCLCQAWQWWRAWKLLKEPFSEATLPSNQGISRFPLKWPVCVWRINRNIFSLHSKRNLSRRHFLSRQWNSYWRQISNFTAGLWNSKMMYTNQRRGYSLGMKRVFESNAGS